MKKLSLIIIMGASLWGSSANAIMYEKPFEIAQAEMNAPSELYRPARLYATLFHEWFEVDWTPNKSFELIRAPLNDFKQDIVAARDKVLIDPGYEIDPDGDPQQNAAILLIYNHELSVLDEIIGRIKSIGSRQRTNLFGNNLLWEELMKLAEPILKVCVDAESLRMFRDRVVRIACLAEEDVSLDDLINSIDMLLEFNPIFCKLRDDRLTTELEKHYLTQLEQLADQITNRLTLIAGDPSMRQEHKTELQFLRGLRTAIEVVTEWYSYRLHLRTVQTLGEVPLHYGRRNSAPAACYSFFVSK